LQPSSGEKVKLPSLIPDRKRLRIPSGISTFPGGDSGLCEEDSGAILRKGLEDLSEVIIEEKT
jgi:hypothetical protein